MPTKIPTNREIIVQTIRTLMLEVESTDAVDMGMLSVSEEAIRETAINAVADQFESKMDMGRMERELIWMGALAKLIFENVILNVRLMQVQNPQDAQRVAESLLARVAASKK